jgi:hypothetical protein
VLSNGIKRTPAEQSSAHKPLDLLMAVGEFKTLPYRTGPMASRHWGHPRHQLCSFPSKIKPAIAAVLVRLFSSPGETVLDLFSGSGTIPFEAALQGCKAIASDISPLAFVVTSSKINPPSEEELTSALRSLRNALANNAVSVDLSDMEGEIQDFYHPRTAAEILIARAFLAELTHGFTCNRAGLFLAACLAHIMHGNRPYALSRRSHNIIPIPPRGPAEYKPVYNAVQNKALRTIHYPLPPDFQRGKVYLAAADCLPLEEGAVDVVITSPPFLGTTDFLRQNRIRNWLVGWSYSEQKQRQPLFLEHDSSIERYRLIVDELARVTRLKATVVFHLGMVRSTNMAESLSALFKDKGFHIIDIVWEDVSSLESHGRTDRGATHRHGFMILQK